MARKYVFTGDPKIERWNDNISDLGVEGIYQRLLNTSKGSGETISMRAPALSSEFTRSRINNVAKAGIDGALFEISFPSDKQVNDILKRKHEDDDLFGYRCTAASDAFPAGYGERSSQALIREDNIHQLKGTFPSALVAISKLKARVDARQGDVSAVNRIFARMWGLNEDQMDSLPAMRISGSEQTRMSAMEDRAYHALAAHPAYSGGYRVDMASVSTSAFGETVPINWQRLRVGAKTVAQLQSQGDEEQMRTMSILLRNSPFKWTMDVVQGSQPKYSRSYPWEVIVDKLSKADCTMPIDGDIVPSTSEMMLYMTQTEAFAENLLTDPRNQICKPLTVVADLVRKDASAAFDRTIEIMAMYQQERAMMDDELGEEFKELEGSELRRTFEVPEYKVTRATLRNVLMRDNYGSDDLPDMRSHGTAPLRMNHAEFRASGLTAPVTIPGALHMAVYITSVKHSMAISAYQLLSAVPDPSPGAPGPVSVRLRDPRLYDNEAVYNIGSRLFSEEFMGLFEIISSNVTVKDTKSDAGIKSELWDYLTCRGTRSSICPVNGGWRDLIIYLRSRPRGWRLYYWARISIGRLQYAMSSTILAPVTAGKEVDFLSLMKSSVRERASRWKAFYQAKYTDTRDQLLHMIEQKHELKMLRRPFAYSPDVMAYIPPHLRDQVSLDYVYNKEPSGFNVENHKKYQYMVEMQVKAKFFDKMDAVSHHRLISVGVSDQVALDMLIEFYQARWYSLEKRLKKMALLGKPLKLGKVKYYKHPWGEFIKEYPPNIDEMMLFNLKLDQRAWTVDPRHVWKKLRKSIGELWNDIGEEISGICRYIEDVTDVQADEQICAMLRNRAQDVMNAMAGIPAIVLPAVGYRAPHTLPERNLTLPTPHGLVSVPTSASTYIDPAVTTEGDYDDGSGYDDGWDPDGGDAFESMANMSFLMSSKIGKEDQTLEVQEALEYLSLNDIWGELGLEDAPDAAKRITMGVAFDTDLNAPHIDSQIVPIVSYDDRTKTRRIWASKLVVMRKRMGSIEPLSQADDM